MIYEFLIFLILCAIMFVGQLILKFRLIFPDSIAYKIMMTIYLAITLFLITICLIFMYEHYEFLQNGCSFCGDFQNLM